MNAVAIFRTPPPIHEIGKLLYKNKKDYFNKHGYPFIHDSSEVDGKHFTWGVPEKILEYFDTDYEWIINSGAEYLFTNMDISGDDIVSKNLKDDQDIFVIGEVLHCIDNKPNPWFGIDENSNITITETLENKMLLCPIGMYIRNTPRTKQLFTNIVNDSRFGEQSQFNKVLPPFIDRFQLAFSLYYDWYPAVREMISVGSSDEYCCLPEGTGEAYDILKRNMKKIAPFNYSEFTKGRYTTLTWCLSSGIDIPSITTIINDNLKNVI